MFSENAINDSDNSNSSHNEIAHSKATSSKATSAHTTTYPTSHEDILKELQWRGAINQETDVEGLRECIKQGSLSVYCGTDPTGDSLHVGHLIPFITLKRFQLAGHHPYILIGGATGMIGDPSGRSSERVLQSSEQILDNEKKLTDQMVRIFGTENFDVVNNKEWLGKLNLLDFLRQYGKSFSVNAMLAKDSVAQRLEGGISFTEFSYQILQAIDFLHLFEKNNVQLQIGGSDQWGNIVNGVDLIHRKDSQAQVFGLTIPLMLKSDGTKFGKSAGGAVWLDPQKTSVYEFYQFWLNQDDSDVIKYLKYFTFLSCEEIEELEKKLQNEPEKREAQRALARSVTTLVHGQKATDRAEEISRLLFTGDITQLTADEISQALGSIPRASIIGEPIPLIELLITVGASSSRRQAREDITNGAIRLNGQKVTDIELVVDPQSAFDGRFVVIRRGKRKYFLAKVDEGAATVK